MSKRSLFTLVTPLPPGISRECIMSFLYTHTEMIDLNPLVIERHPIRAPPHASAEEAHCQWYSITDKVQYIPGGVASGKVTYTGCFHNLPTGIQTHCFAPMGLNIRSKWSLGGSLAGEPKVVQELGVGIPKDGLYLREDVDMKCNVFMISFVKKVFRKAHSTLVDRLVEKAHILEANAHNEALERASVYSGCPSSPDTQHVVSPTGAPSIRSMTQPDTSRHPSYQSLDPYPQAFPPPPSYNQSPQPPLPYPDTASQPGGSPHVGSHASAQYDPRKVGFRPQDTDRTYRDPNRASYDPRPYSWDQKDAPYGRDSYAQDGNQYGVAGNPYGAPGNIYPNSPRHPSFQMVELPGQMGAIPVAYQELVPKPLGYQSSRLANTKPTELE
ncbi:hypothetical protein MMC34_002354 [Xylographa carneopallida]|nr:hypothetical protein [Xylographa carneopallida]